MNTQPWLQCLGVFDLETTGVDVHGDRIVTAYVGLIDEDGKSTDEHSWLADAGIIIPAGAEAVHGISTAFAEANGRPPAEVVAEIIAQLRAYIDAKIVIVAYNAAFDFSMLNAEAIRYGIEPLPARFPILDPFILDKHIDKFRKGSRKLTDTCASYGVVLESAHDASADAIAAGRLTQAMFLTPKAAVLPEKLRDVYDLIIVEAAAQAASFQAYLRKDKDPLAVIDGRWPVRPVPVDEPAAA